MEFVTHLLACLGSMAAAARHSWARQQAWLLLVSFNFLWAILCPQAVDIQNKFVLKVPGGSREPAGVHLPVEARGQEQAALRPQARAVRPLPAAGEVPLGLQLQIQPEVGPAIEAGAAAGVPLLHQRSDPGESKSLKKARTRGQWLFRPALTRAIHLWLLIIVSPVLPFSVFSVFRALGTFCPGFDSGFWS